MSCLCRRDVDVKRVMVDGRQELALCCHCRADVAALGWRIHPVDRADACPDCDGSGAQMTYGGSLIEPPEYEPCVACDGTGIRIGAPRPPLATPGDLDDVQFCGGAR
jgi:hypothetical protein